MTEVTNLIQYKQLKEEEEVNALRLSIIDNYNIDPDKVPELTPVINIFINQILTFQNYIKKYQIKNP